MTLTHAIFDLDICDLLASDFCPMNYFLVTDGQTDRLIYLTRTETFLIQNLLEALVCRLRTEFTSGSGGSAMLTTDRRDGQTEGDA